METERALQKAAASWARTRTILVVREPRALIAAARRNGRGAAPIGAKASVEPAHARAARTVAREGVKENMTAVSHAAGEKQRQSCSGDDKS